MFFEKNVIEGDMPWHLFFSIFPKSVMNTDALKLSDWSLSGDIFDEIRSFIQ